MFVSRFVFAEALACRALWDWFVLSFENDLMVVKDLFWKIRAGNIDPLLTVFLDFQILGDLQRKKRIMNRYIVSFCYIYLLLLYCKWDLSCSVGRLKSSTHLHPLHSARGTLHLTSILRSEPEKSNTWCLIHKFRDLKLWVWKPSKIMKFASALGICWHHAKHIQWKIYVQKSVIMVYILPFLHNHI